MGRTRPRSALFDAAEESMKRLTGFFAGSSSETTQTREGKQTPPPLPIPPPIPTVEEGATTPTDSAPANNRPNAPQLSISLPSPRKFSHDNPMDTLTPPMSGHNPCSSGVANAHLQPLPQSPAPSVGGSRNFSGASYASYASQTSQASHVSHASHASHPSQTSYASYTSSRPTSSYRNAAGSPFPPTPTSPSATSLPLDMPRHIKKKAASKGGGFFGRKKKDNADQPVAWRLTRASAESLAPYDINSLTKGEPVSDLWDSEGDTLVYLAPKTTTSPKFTSPSFRIRSSPLLFSTLGSYIEDCQTYTQVGDLQSSDALAPNDLFLEVPSMNHPQAVTATTSSDIGSSVMSDLQNLNSSEETSKANGAGSVLIPNPEEARGNSATGGSQDPTVMYRVYYPALDFDTPPKPPKNKKSKRNSQIDDTTHRLLDARNLFAFLALQYLVATHARETIYRVFAKIFDKLEISDIRESELGYVSTASRIYMAESHFSHYIDELRMDDIRNDDDAIVEALIMGETWRCQRLYTEGFIHACGRWEEIKGHPGFVAISNKTKARLDRASIDLHQTRIMNVETRIHNFDFPSVWIGDGRYPEFKPWRNGYDAMRKHTISYYRHYFGSWPPRAGRHGKGGGFTETGGLNRVVLKRLYDDFAELYDLLVDREWIHGERIHFEANYVSDGDDVEAAKSKEEHARNTMRKIMEEFDHSYMPIQPGIPFDLPRLPYISATPPPTTDEKRKKKSSKPRSAKKLKSDELSSVLKESYNSDVLERQPLNPFVSAYMDLERGFGSGKTVNDLAEARRGRWIFMYCVLQSLPMTTVDAQNLSYGNGVEYFLCENLKGSMPWDKTNRRDSRLSGLWAPGPGGNFLASMTNLCSDDEIDNTFRRSHCWVVAENWRMIRGSGDDEIEFDDESGSAAGTLEYGSQNGRNSEASQYSPQLGPEAAPALADEAGAKEKFQKLRVGDGTGNLQDQYSDVYSTNPYIQRDYSQDQQYYLPQLQQPHSLPRATYNADFLQSPISPTQVSLPQTPQNGTPISSVNDGKETPSIDTQMSRSQSPQLPSPRRTSALETDKLKFGEVKFNSVGSSLEWLHH